MAEPWKPATTKQRPLVTRNARDASGRSWLDDPSSVVSGSLAGGRLDGIPGFPSASSRPRKPDSPPMYEADSSGGRLGMFPKGGGAPTRFKLANSATSEPRGSTASPVLLHGSQQSPSLAPMSARPVSSQSSRLSSTCSPERRGSVPPVLPGIGTVQSQTPIGDQLLQLQARSATVQQGAMLASTAQTTSQHIGVQGSELDGASRVAQRNVTRTEEQPPQSACPSPVWITGIQAVRPQTGPRAIVEKDGSGREENLTALPHPPALTPLARHLEVATRISERQFRDRVLDVVQAKGGPLLKLAAYGQELANELTAFAQQVESGFGEMESIVYGKDGVAQKEGQKDPLKGDRNARKMPSTGTEPSTSKTTHMQVPDSKQRLNRKMRKTLTAVRLGLGKKRSSIERIQEEMELGDAELDMREVADVEHEKHNDAQEFEDGAGFVQDDEGEEDEHTSASSNSEAGELPQQLLVSGFSDELANGIFSLVLESAQDEERPCWFKYGSDVSIRWVEEEATDGTAYRGWHIGQFGFESTVIARMAPVQRKEKACGDLSLHPGCACKWEEVNVLRPSGFPRQILAEGKDEDAGDCDQDNDDWIIAEDANIKELPAPPEVLHLHDEDGRLSGTYVYLDDDAHQRPVYHHEEKTASIYWNATTERWVAERKVGGKMIKACGCQGMQGDPTQVLYWQWPETSRPFALLVPLSPSDSHRGATKGEAQTVLVCLPGPAPPRCIFVKGLDSPRADGLYVRIMRLHNGCPLYHMDRGEDEELHYLYWDAASHYWYITLGSCAPGVYSSLARGTTPDSTLMDPLAASKWEHVTEIRKKPYKRWDVAHGLSLEAVEEPAREIFLDVEPGLVPALRNARGIYVLQPGYHEGRRHYAKERDGWTIRWQAEAVGWHLTQHAQEKIVSRVCSRKASLAFGGNESRSHRSSIAGLAFPISGALMHLHRRSREIPEDVADAFPVGRPSLRSALEMRSASKQSLGGRDLQVSLGLGLDRPADSPGLQARRDSTESLKSNPPGESIVVRRESVAITESRRMSLAPPSLMVSRNSSRRGSFVGMSKRGSIASIETLEDTDVTYARAFHDVPHVGQLPTDTPSWEAWHEASETWRLEPGIQIVSKWVPPRSVYITGSVDAEIFRGVYFLRGLRDGRPAYNKDSDTEPLPARSTIFWTGAPHFAWRVSAELGAAGARKLLAMADLKEDIPLPSMRKCTSWLPVKDDKALPTMAESWMPKDPCVDLELVCVPAEGHKAIFLHGYSPSVDGVFYREDDELQDGRCIFRKETTLESTRAMVLRWVRSEQRWGLFGAWPESMERAHPGGILSNPEDAPDPSLARRPWQKARSDKFNNRLSIGVPPEDEKADVNMDVLDRIKAEAMRKEDTRKWIALPALKCEPVERAPETIYLTGDGLKGSFGGIYYLDEDVNETTEDGSRRRPTYTGEEAGLATPCTIRFVTAVSRWIVERIPRMRGGKKSLKHPGIQRNITGIDVDPLKCALASVAYDAPHPAAVEAPWEIKHESTWIEPEACSIVCRVVQPPLPTVFLLGPSREQQAVYGTFKLLPAFQDNRPAYGREGTQQVIRYEAQSRRWILSLKGNEPDSANLLVADSSSPYPADLQHVWRKLDPATESWEEALGFACYPGELPPKQIYFHGGCQAIVGVYNFRHRRLFNQRGSFVKEGTRWHVWWSQVQKCWIVGKLSLPDLEAAVAESGEPFAHECGAYSKQDVPHPALCRDWLFGAQAEVDLDDPFICEAVADPPTAVVIRRNLGDSETRAHAAGVYVLGDGSHGGRCYFEKQCRTMKADQWTLYFASAHSKWYLHRHGRNSMRKPVAFAASNAPDPTLVPAAAWREKEDGNWVSGSEFLVENVGEAPPTVFLRGVPSDGEEPRGARTPSVNGVYFLEEGLHNGRPWYRKDAQQGKKYFLRFCPETIRWVLETPVPTALHRGSTVKNLSGAEPETASAAGAMLIWLPCDCWHPVGADAYWTVGQGAEEQGGRRDSAIKSNKRNPKPKRAPKIQQLERTKTHSIKQIRRIRDSVCIDGDTHNIAIFASAPKSSRISEEGANTSATGLDQASLEAIADGETPAFSSEQGCSRHSSKSSTGSDSTSDVAVAKPSALLSLAKSAMQRGANTGGSSSSDEEKPETAAEDIKKKPSKESSKRGVRVTATQPMPSGAALPRTERTERSIAALEVGDAPERLYLTPMVPSQVAGVYQLAGWHCGRPGYRLVDPVNGEFKVTLWDASPSPSSTAAGRRKSVMNKKAQTPMGSKGTTASSFKFSPHGYGLRFHPESERWILGEYTQTFRVDYRRSCPTDDIALEGEIGQPFTLLRAAEGGTAEKVGVPVGSWLMRINGKAVLGWTHVEDLTSYLEELELPVVLEFEYEAFATGPEGLASLKYDSPFPSSVCAPWEVISDGGVWTAPEEPVMCRAVELPPRYISVSGYPTKRYQVNGIYDLLPRLHCGRVAYQGRDRGDKFFVRWAPTKHSWVISNEGGGSSTREIKPDKIYKLRLAKATCFAEHPGVCEAHGGTWEMRVEQQQPTLRVTYDEDDRIEPHDMAKLFTESLKDALAECGDSSQLLLAESDRYDEAKIRHLLAKLHLIIQGADAIQMLASEIMAFGITSELVETAMKARQRLFGYLVLEHIVFQTEQEDSNMETWYETLTFTRTLLEKEKAEPMCCYTDTGWTALHFIAKSGVSEFWSYDTGAALLKAKGDLQAQDRMGITPLLLAIAWRRLENVRAFLRLAVTFDTRRGAGTMFSSTGERSLAATLAAEVAVGVCAEKLPLRASEGTEERAALFATAEFGSWGELKPIVMIQTEHLNEKRALDGKTALHLAAERNQAAMVEILTTEGADINVKDNDGNTPLHVAARAKAVVAVCVLLRSGASCSMRNNAGSSAYMLAIESAASESALEFRKQMVPWSKIEEVLGTHRIQDATDWKSHVRDKVEQLITLGFGEASADPSDPKKVDKLQIMNQLVTKDPNPEATRCCLLEPRGMLLSKELLIPLLRLTSENDLESVGDTIKYEHFVRYLLAAGCAIFLEQEVKITVENGVSSLQMMYEEIHGGVYEALQNLTEGEEITFHERGSAWPLCHHMFVHGEIPWLSGDIGPTALERALRSLVDVEAYDTIEALAIEAVPNGDKFRTIQSIAGRDVHLKPFWETAYAHWLVGQAHHHSHWLRAHCSQRWGARYRHRDDLSLDEVMQRKEHFRKACQDHFGDVVAPWQRGAEAWHLLEAGAIMDLLCFSVTAQDVTEFTALFHEFKAMTLEADKLQVAYIRNGYSVSDSAEEYKDVVFGLRMRHRPGAPLFFVEARLVLCKYSRIKTHMDIFDGFRQGAYTFTHMATRKLRYRGVVQQGEENTEHRRLDFSTIREQGSIAGTFVRRFALDAGMGAIALWRWIGTESVDNEDQYLQFLVNTLYPPKEAETLSSGLGHWKELYADGVEISGRRASLERVTAETEGRMTEVEFEDFCREEGLNVDSIEVHRTVGQLVAAEARLFRDPNGRLVKVRDVVMVAISCPQKEQVLVQESTPCGPPSVARKTDETLVAAARRALHDHFPNGLEAQFNVQNFSTATEAGGDCIWQTLDPVDEGEEPQRRLATACRYFKLQAKLRERAEVFEVLRMGFGV